MIKIYKILLFISFMCLVAVKAFAQYKDLPNPPIDLQNIPQGSLVIPMDNNNQNIGSPFNLKAYGLVHSLLLNDIPVKWVIKSGKVKDGIDFSATAERLYPSFVASANINFIASAFIIDSVWINKPSPFTGQTATQVITSYGNNVAVFRLSQNVTVDVRYDLDFRPKIAVFNNGGNQAIHVAILTGGGVTNYNIINAGVFTGLAECYTFCSEAHWQATIADTAITGKVRDFVFSGGNFLAQCHAVHTNNPHGYENNHFFQTTTGLDEIGINTTGNTYYNVDLAVMQFHGLMQHNEGGSGKNWRLKAGSSWKSGFYHAVSTANAKDTIVFSGAKLTLPLDTAGGNVFYLGGHDYAPYTALLDINAARLYLNATLIPAARPTAFALTMGPSTTICQGQQTTLSASGPAGTTYNWSPSTGLSCITCQNPVATPTVTTTYVIIADNGGCRGAGTVTITVNPLPAAPIASSNNSVCTGSTINLFADTIAGATYSWSGPNGFSSSLQNPVIINATTANTATYSVIATVGGCPGPSGTTSVTVNPTPTASGTQNNVSCFGGSNGSATVSPTGGTPAYIYLWSDGQTASTANNLQTGSYSVTVTDTKGCTTTASFSITEPAAALTSTASQSNVSCFGGSNGMASVSASGGTSPYTYLWSGGQTTSSVSGLLVGNYSVTITDTKNCTATSSFTITQPSAALTSTTSQTNVSCFGGSNGTASVSASGGTSPYTYLWNGGQTTSSISGLSAGTYTVTTTDTKGCTAVATAPVTQPTVLSSTAMQTNVCSGASNGLAAVSISGGTSPYTYLWSNGQTTSSATGLSAGSYSVTTTDFNGCTSTSTVTISLFPSISSSASQTNVSCFGGSNGSATVIPSGGTTPFSYQWNNGQTTTSITNLAASNYSVTTTDANGCTATSSVSITQPSALTATASNSNVSCFGGSNGTASVSASGGTPGYTYLWSSGQTASSANGLTAGNYSVTVTDTNGCAATSSTTIGQPLTALVSTTSQNNVSCFGGTNGSAFVTASGGTPGYAYLWNSGQTTTSASGLSAGNYSVTVTDVNGCIATVTVTITQPSVLSSAAMQTNVCSGASNGTAAVTASGGTSPYTYLWSNGQTTSSVSGLSAGSYSVTTTDDKGCTTLATVIISLFPSISSSATQTNVSCLGGNNGSATVIPSGGTSPFSYLWSSGQTTSTASGFSAGNYSVTITDANGCTAISSVTITQPSTALASGTSQGNVSCFGGSNGTASVSASGGTPGYTYLWSNGQTTSTASGLQAGTYSVTTTDANGCTSVASLTIIQPAAALTATVLYNNVSCFGAGNGSASVSASGGTPGYNYLWNTGQIASSLTGLAPGSYSVTVTDNNGCTASSSFTITQPSVLAVNTVPVSVSCNGGTNGSATAAVSGGTSPYTYLWNTGATGATASNLTVGTYTVTISDSNSCAVTGSVTVNEPIAIALSFSFAPSTCNQSDGSATVTASGGTGAYSYLWSNGQTTATASNIPSANYFVTVTDANGCTQTGSVQVYNNPGVTAIPVTSASVTCNGSCNGSATVGGTGGVPPYTYLWVNGATTTSINNLCAGTYTVTVTDSTGCISSTAFYITQPALLSATITPTHISCFGNNNGSAIAAVNGGVSPYSYSWNTGATTSAISNLTAGSYSVTVTDNNGCTNSASVIIIEPNPVSIITNNKKDISCFGAGDGLIAVTGNGGTPAYTYSWSPNVGSSSSVSNLAIGNYQVLVLDQNGCKDSLSFNITQPAALVTTTISISPPTCYAGNNGSASISVSGGTTPYQYAWSTVPVQTGITATNLSQGSYTAYVTDTNNCKDSLQITITQPTPVITTAGMGDTICLGQSATISASTSGGTGNYTYSWSPSITGNGSTQTVSPTVSTTYTVTAYDQNNCFYQSDTIAINVFSLTPGSITMSATTPICPGQSSQVSVMVTGNTGSLTYSWNNGLGNGTGPYTVTPSQPTTYVVTITNSCGTVIKDSIKVNFNPPPTVLFSPDTLEGCTPVTIYFSDQSLTGNNSDPITSWFWSFGDGSTSTLQNPSHTYNNAGTYSVVLQVTTLQGCTNSNSANPVLIIAHPIPNALFSVNSTNLLIPVDLLKCNNQSTGATIYYWSFGDGATSNQTDPEHKYNTSGNYVIQLIATSAFGCADTMYLDVTVTPTITFPSAFTPDPNSNSNGYYDPNSLDNNIFFPYTADVVEFELLIFDRWGELIFETHDIKQGWNGYFKEKICQQDVYVYKGYVKFINGKVYRKTGDVTLIR
ncbi:MAG: PKD domain-containing protein [Bacteroidetes bacterium]|nr:PKD domain-containing protein [Bacteroidota bacterium]